MILIGFAAVLAPLIAAVITAVIQVDRLAGQSHSAVLEAEIATQQSRALVEQLTEMQRALGQFRVLADRDFYEIYVERRAAFSNAITNLLELSFTEAGRDLLQRLRRDEQALFAKIHERPALDLGDYSSANEWSGLAALARGVLAESGTLVEQQANYATSAADAVQRTLLLLAAAVIPAAIVLAALFTVLITKPLRQVQQGINRLGARELDDPIHVKGPQDLEALGRQLDWLRRRIRELEEQKLTFLRHISHELKTPLTTLREGAELLVESLATSAPEEAELSRIMRNDSLRLQALIEDLLQFGKMQAPITDLQIAESVDLRALVHAVVVGQMVAASSKRIVVERDLAPVALACDANKIRVVVDNLLANAIKFTPAEGRVTVSLAEDGHNALIDVRDTGPGIADTDQERIFEPFYQGRTEYQSSVKGTGLGLAIAREYAEAHDGSITVERSERGAHFRFRLPLSASRNGHGAH